MRKSAASILAALVVVLILGGGAFLYIKQQERVKREAMIEKIIDGYCIDASLSKGSIEEIESASYDCEKGNHGEATALASLDYDHLLQRLTELCLEKNAITQVEKLKQTFEGIDGVAKTDEQVCHAKTADVLRE